MSITADREVYALESRSESLDLICGGDFLREGDSDRIEVGMGALVDSVDGSEESSYGSLSETHDHKLNRLIGAQELEVTGSYSVTGKEEMMMITGAFAETEAGGSLFAGGMSDVLLGGAGMRLTQVGDLWLAGLFGMEEKIASGVADGMLLEISGMSFEREYVSSTYNGSFGYQNAAVTHTTTATGFLPMLKVVRGLRNQLPGSGAPEGEGSEPSSPTPPPAAAAGGEGGDAAEGVDGGVRAGTGVADAAEGDGVADVVRTTESASGAGDAVTDGTRLADTSTGATRHTDGLLEGITSTDEVVQTDEVAQVSDVDATKTAANADDAPKRRGWWQRFRFENFGSPGYNPDRTAQHVNKNADSIWRIDHRPDWMIQKYADDGIRPNGPRYSEKGLVVDPGCLYGLSEEVVGWRADGFAESGYQVAWVDGRWTTTHVGAEAADNDFLKIPYTLGDTANTADAAGDAARPASDTIPAGFRAGADDAATNVNQVNQASQGIGGVDEAAEADSTVVTTQWVDEILDTATESTESSIVSSNSPTTSTAPTSSTTSTSGSTVPTTSTPASGTRSGGRPTPIFEPFGSPNYDPRQTQKFLNEHADTAWRMDVRPDWMIEKYADDGVRPSGPRYGDNGLVVDPGCLYGLNEEVVGWRAEGFQESGYQVAWVDGRWTTTYVGPEAADNAFVKVPHVVVETAADTAADTINAADAAPTGPIQHIDYPSYNKKNKCTDPGPYFGKSRVKVERDFRHYDRQGMLLNWQDGQWHRIGTFETPRINSRGTVADDGPFKGVSEADVWAAREYYADQGRWVEWGQNESGWTWVDMSDDMSMYDNYDELAHVQETGNVGPIWRPGDAIGQNVPTSQMSGMHGPGGSPTGRRLALNRGGQSSSAPRRWFKWRRPPFRHPKTARRLNKMSELSKANQQSAITAATHQAFNQQVLSGGNASSTKSAQDQARNAEKVQAAVNRLNETVGSSSDSSSGNWWKASEDMRGQDGVLDGGDGRHMVEGQGDIEWTSHLDRLYKAVERPQETVPTGADIGKVSRQANVPADKGVFGVVNPALDSGQPLADVPTSAPVVGGPDGRHLLPTGSSVEQVSAPSVMRAVDDLEVKSAPIQKAVIRAEEAVAAGRVRNILKNQIATLKRSQKTAEGPVKAALARQITKAQNTLAALEASMNTAVSKADSASTASSVKMQPIGEVTDTAQSGVRAGSEDGLAKSSWQASESASSGSTATPRMNGVGAEWSDGPPKNIEVERTAVTQGEDGTLSVATVASGSTYNNENWLEMLSNAAPPKGASTGAGWRAGVPTPLTRMQKIRTWFSNKLAQIAQFFRRSGSGGLHAEDSSSGSRSIDRATETSAVLDNIPSRTAGESNQASEVADEAGYAKGWQSSFESGDPISPGSGDLLRQSPDETRGLDTSMELAEGDVVAKADGEEARSVEALESANGNAGVQRSASLESLAEHESGANYDDYKRFNKIRTSIRDDVRDFEQDTTLRQIGTVNDIRNWYDGEVSRRLIGMAQQVDPSNTRESLLRGEDIGRWNLEVDIVFDSIYRLNKQAVVDGDGAAAAGYAEIIRRGANYMEEVRKVADRRVLETTVAEPAPYRTNRVLELIRADADYIEAKRVNFAPLEDFPDDMMIYRREKSIEYSAWDIAVKFLQNREDARAPLYRYLDRSNYAQMASAATTDTYGRVIGRLNDYVEQARLEVGKLTPPINRDGKIYSLFSESDKTDLLRYFDRVDSAEDLASPIGRIQAPMAPRSVDNAASTPPPLPPKRRRRVTDAEGVKYGVSPEFPAVTVRGVQVVETAVDTAPTTRAVGLGGLGSSGIRSAATRSEETTQLIDIQRDTRRWEAAYESVWNSQRQAAGDSPGSVDSVQDVRDWHSTETANRMVELVQQVDPSITRERMVGLEGPTYTNRGKVARGQYRGCTREAVERSRASWEANGYEVRWNDDDGWTISKAPDGISAQSNVEPIYQPDDRIALGKYSGIPRRKVEESRRIKESMGWIVEWNHSRGWQQIQMRPSDPPAPRTKPTPKPRVGKPVSTAGAAPPSLPDGPKFSPDGRVESGKFAGASYQSVKETRENLVSKGYTVEWDEASGWRVTGFEQQNAQPPAPGGPLYVEEKVASGAFAGTPRGEIEQTRRTLESQGKIVAWDDGRGWVELVPGEVAAGPRYDSNKLLADGPFAGTPREEIELARTRMEAAGGTPVWDNNRGWIDASSQAPPGAGAASSDGPGLGAGSIDPNGPRFENDQVANQGRMNGAKRDDMEVAHAMLVSDGKTPVWDDNLGWVDADTVAMPQTAMPSPATAPGGAVDPVPGAGSADSGTGTRSSIDPGGPRYEGGKVVNDGDMKGAPREAMDTEYASLVSQGATPVWDNDVGWVDSAQVAPPQAAAPSPGTVPGSAADTDAGTRIGPALPEPEYDENGFVTNAGDMKGAHRDDMDTTLAQLISQGERPVWDNNQGWVAGAPGAERDLTTAGPPIIDGVAVTGKYKGKTTLEINNIRRALLEDGVPVYYSDELGWVKVVDAPPAEVKSRPNGPPYAVDGTVARGNYRGVGWREVEGVRDMLVAAGDGAPRWDDRLGWVRSGDAPPPGPKFNRKGKLTEGPLAGTSRRDLEKARKAILKGGNTPVWNSQSGWIAGPRMDILAANKSAFDPASRGGRVLGTSRPQYNALGQIEGGTLHGYRHEDVMRLQQELLDRGCDVHWNPETGWEGSVRWADSKAARPPVGGAKAGSQADGLSAAQAADLAGLEFGTDGRIVNLPGNSIYYGWPRNRIQDWAKIFSALGSSSWDAAAGALVRSDAAADASGAYRAEDIRATSDTVPLYGNDGGLAGTSMKGSSRREVDSVHRGMSASGQEVVWDGQAAWKFNVPPGQGLHFSEDGRVVNSRLRGMSRAGVEQVLQAYAATGRTPFWDEAYGVVFKGAAVDAAADAGSAAGPVYDSSGRVVGTAMEGFTKFEVDVLRRELDAIAGGSEWHPQHGLVIAEAPASTLELFQPASGPVYDVNGLVARGTYRGRGAAEIGQMRSSIEGAGVPIVWDDTEGWKFAQEWRQSADPDVPSPEYDQRGRVSSGEYRTHSVAEVDELHDEFSSFAEGRPIEWDDHLGWKFADTPDELEQGRQSSAGGAGRPVYNEDGRLTNGGYLNGLTKWEIDRLHRIQMDIQDGVVWEDGVGWRGVGRLIRNEDSDRIRQFIVAEHSSAVSAGDVERANDLAYVLRHAADYMEATKVQNPEILSHAGEAANSPRASLLTTFNSIDESARQAAARRSQRAADAAANTHALNPATGPIGGTPPAGSTSRPKRRVRFADQPESIPAVDDTRSANSKTPVIYLDPEAASLGQSPRGAGGQSSPRRGILKNIVNPSSQSQFSPTQRATSAGARPTPAPRVPRSSTKPVAAPRAGGSSSSAGRGGLGGLALFQFETSRPRTSGSGGMSVQDYMQGARR